VAPRPGGRRPGLLRRVLDREGPLPRLPGLIRAIAPATLLVPGCFCFNQQHLAASTSAELPLIFFVDPQLPESIHTLTLSYTLYDITDKQLASAIEQGAAK
jgi:cytochrome c oxidase assembly protein subunit 11